MARRVIIIRVLALLVGILRMACEEALRLCVCCRVKEWGGTILW